MTRRQKHLARDFDRAYAAELVRLYRTKELPRYMHEGREYTDLPVDGDRLAAELEIFAARGTWETPAIAIKREGSSTWEFVTHDEFHGELRRDRWRERFKEMRAEGHKATDLILRLAEAYSVSDQTIADAVYQRKKKRGKKKRGD